MYGTGIPLKENAYAQGTENHPLQPVHIYGLTKKLGEEIAEYYFRVHGLSTICLRLGMFVAASDLIFYGFRLLGGGVDERDVAEAFLLAIENNEIKYNAYNIVSDVPFSVEDEKQLFINPEQILEKYYPGAKRIFEQKQINAKEHLDIWGSKYWSNHKAKKELEFYPQYNFDRFLNALRKDDDSYYPFAGLPWWGIKK